MGTLRSAGSLEMYLAASPRLPMLTHSRTNGCVGTRVAAGQWGSMSEAYGCASGVGVGTRSSKQPSPPGCHVPSRIHVAHQHETPHLVANGRFLRLCKLFKLHPVARLGQRLHLEPPEPFVRHLKLLLEPVGLRCSNCDHACQAQKQASPRESHTQKYAPDGRGAANARSLPQCH